MIFVAGYGWSHVSLIKLFLFSWRLPNNLISGHVRFWLLSVMFLDFLSNLGLKIVFHQ